MDIFGYVRKNDPRKADDFTTMFNMIETFYCCFNDVLEVAMDLYEKNIHLRDCEKWKGMLIHLCVYEAILQTRSKQFAISEFCRIYDITIPIQEFEKEYENFTPHLHIKEPDEHN